MIQDDFFSLAASSRSLFLNKNTEKAYKRPGQSVLHKNQSAPKTSKWKTKLDIWEGCSFEHSVIVVGQLVNRRC